MRIDELHDKLFDVLCVIDDVCRVHNVRYFLDGGTELGSVREKDFIPWDDDMDIKILAEDLPRFYEVMEANLPEHMHIVMPDVFSPYFYDFTVRIYDDRYLIRKETSADSAYGNYQNRVGTDVFLLQKMPNSSLSRWFVVLYIKILYGMGMGYRYNIENYEKFSVLQKLEVKILSALGKVSSLEKIIKKFFKLTKKWENKNSQYRLGSNSPLNYLKVMPGRLFEGKAFGEIRGRKFPIPEGYDKELTILYGDYMNPPKDRKQYVQHLDEEEAWKEGEK